MENLGINISMYVYIMYIIFFSGVEIQNYEISNQPFIHYYTL